MLANGCFRAKVDPASGTLHGLVRPGDPLATEYLMGAQNHPELRVADSRWTGDVVLRYRVGTDRTWRTASTGASGDVRKVATTPSAVTTTYAQRSASGTGLRDQQLTETFRLEGDALVWRFTLTNTSGASMELGDLGLPLLFNQEWGTSQAEMYQGRVFQHTCLARDGSYLVIERLNGIGPKLVMTALPGTPLEHFTRQRSGWPLGGRDGEWIGVYTAYVHSAATGGESHLPHTSGTLAAGEARTYGFRFRWAEDDEDVGRVLYEDGLLDVTVTPGMAVPTDLIARVDLRSREPVTGLAAEFPAETQITPVPGAPAGHAQYAIRFSRLGAQAVTVEYGQGRRMVLQFFALEPLEQLIRRRAAFIVNHQQERDASKGWYHAFLMWDMATRRMPTRDTDPAFVRWPWVVGGSDEVGFSDALFLAEKNLYAPDPAEIAALEDYLRDFVWGYLQNHDDHGVRKWWVPPGEPATHTRRSYNYPHLFNIYSDMYRIARRYGATRYLDADAYLLRAYRTARAMFTLEMSYDGGKKLGNMGELGIPVIIADLRAEGHAAEANELEGFWKAKIDWFDATPYNFGSEITQDSTAFETAYALGTYGGRTALVHQAIAANRSNRGKQPIWYYYATDLRNMAEAWWNVSYMTQLGGWALQDHALTSSTRPELDVRLAYGAYLAGWTLINSGYYSSDPANLGAAAWVYQAELGGSDWSAGNEQPVLNGGWSWTGESGIGFFAGLRMATAVVTEDPVFGLTGWGCEASRSGGDVQVTPRDGVRKRVAFASMGVRLALERDQWRTVTLSAGRDRLAFTLDNQDGTAHTTRLAVKGLAAGRYEVRRSGAAPVAFRVSGAGEVAVDLPVAAGANAAFTIEPETSAGGAP